MLKQKDKGDKGNENTFCMLRKYLPFTYGGGGNARENQSCWAC